MDLLGAFQTLRYQMKLVAIAGDLAVELYEQAQAGSRGRRECFWLRQKTKLLQDQYWLEPKRQQPGRTKERSDKRTGREDRRGARRERRKQGAEAQGAEEARRGEGGGEPREKKRKRK